MARRNRRPDLTQQRMGAWPDRGRDQPGLTDCPVGRQWLSARAIELAAGTASTGAGALPQLGAEPGTALGTT
ncbi:MAG: hypothetical protein ACO3GW_06780, partial [Vulcanococcus sp.]